MDSVDTPRHSMQGEIACGMSSPAGMIGTLRKVWPPFVVRAGPSSQGGTAKDSKVFVLFLLL